MLHIIFSTKDRRPLISDNLEGRLHAYIATVCEDLGCPVILIGGMPDHVHIFLSLGRTIAVSELISKTKANSSRWAKAIEPSFSWQSGYGVFSVSESARQPVINYIANQKSHHAKFSFQDEFRLLLAKYQVSFDEKYVWD